MSTGELITGVCWLLLIVGSVGWLAVGVVRVIAARRHRRRFPAFLDRFRPAR